MIDHGVTVTLNADQAIVLSDWLYRVIGTERFDSFIDGDTAIWSPLYQLHGALETKCLRSSPATRPPASRPPAAGSSRP